MWSEVSGSGSPVKSPAPLSGLVEIPRVGPTSSCLCVGRGVTGPLPKTTRVSDDPETSRVGPVDYTTEEGWTPFPTPPPPWVVETTYPLPSSFGVVVLKDVFPIPV